MSARGRHARQEETITAQNVSVGTLPMGRAANARQSANLGRFIRSIPATFPAPPGAPEILETRYGYRPPVEFEQVVSLKRADQTILNL